MNVREGVIDKLESGPFTSSLDAVVGTTAMHGVLKHSFGKGGLEVTYPNGTSYEYGDRPPELAVRVNSARPILRMTVDPTLAIGEGYMVGDIDFEDPGDAEAPPPIDLLAKFMSENGFFDMDQKFGKWTDRLRPYTQPNRPQFHGKQVSSHYDLGNDFYDLFLDPSRTYSCAYWEKGPDNMSLQEAQEAKVGHVLSKLRLEDGDRLLDIGSGWGHLAVRAAKEHDIEAVGVTLSKEQLSAATELAAEEGVEDRVTFMEADLLDLAQDPDYQETFDVTSSVGMFEHMGEAGADDYFDAVNRLTKPGGRTFNHFISQQRDKPAAAFLRTYIFPGGHLHPIGNVLNTAARHGFRDPQVESLRPHYAWTLDAWRDNYETHIPEVEEMFEAGRINHPLIKTGQIGTAEEFTRMWRFYLATSSGGFRYGHLDLAQCEWTKGIDTSAPFNRRHIYDDATA